MDFVFQIRTIEDENGPYIAELFTESALRKFHRLKATTVRSLKQIANSSFQLSDLGEGWFNTKNKRFGTVFIKGFYRAVRECLTGFWIQLNNLIIDLSLYESPWSPFKHHFAFKPSILNLLRNLELTKNKNFGVLSFWDTQTIKM